MSFYSVEFLKNQATVNELFKYGLLFVVLGLLLLVFSLYMKHRLQTKYRDLSIIFFLILLLITGIQFSNYESNRSQHTGISTMVTFVQRFAHMKHVSEDEIYVSNTQLVDELLVKIDDSYYRVDLSQDGQSFTLAKTQLVNTDIVLVTQ